MPHSPVPAPALPAYDTGDQLHPGDAGLAASATVDLPLFSQGVIGQ